MKLQAVARGRQVRRRGPIIEQAIQAGAITASRCAQDGNSKRECARVASEAALERILAIGGDPLESATAAYHARRTVDGSERAALRAAGSAAATAESRAHGTCREKHN